MLVSKRSTTDTCCLTLPLRLEKWQADRLAKRFEIARQIYNTLVRAELKKLVRLERISAYKDIQQQLYSLYRDGHQNSREYNVLFQKCRSLLTEAGIREYGFKGDIAKYYKHFHENIGSSVAVHCIASQVWCAFDKYLFHNGKQVHFKRAGDIRSLKGYSVSGKSGGTEIIYRGTFIEWKGLRLPLKLDPDNRYEAEMLTKRVKYVRLLRTRGKHQDRWYAQLVLEGTPAVKHDAKTNALRHPIGHGAVGIDIGPQTIAYVAQDEAALMELANRVQNIEREKLLIQRKMDRSRRATNPDNYAVDGTIKRGVKLTRNKSKRYCTLQHRLAFIQSRQALIRKVQHTEMANHLLSLGDRFYVENMEWSSLTHRASETAISEKTGRYKRKKRFGKSISNKAPATLIGILEQKCKSLGLPGVIKVPTKLCASQYNHMTDTREKKPLSQRWNDMPDGHRIQRDLYSAFLLQHVTPQEDGFDRPSLQRDYEKFVSLHDEVIRQLTLAPKTLSSMGIRRT